MRLFLAGFERPLHGGENRGNGNERRGKGRKERKGKDGRKHPLRNKFLNFSAVLGPPVTCLQLATSATDDEPAFSIKPWRV